MRAELEPRVQKHWSLSGATHFKIVWAGVRCLRNGAFPFRGKGRSDTRSVPSVQRCKFVEWPKWPLDESAKFLSSSSVCFGSSSKCPPRSLTSPPCAESRDGGRGGGCGRGTPFANGPEFLKWTPSVDVQWLLLGTVFQRDFHSNGIVYFAVCSHFHKCAIFKRDGLVLSGFKEVGCRVPLLPDFEQSIGAEIQDRTHQVVVTTPTKDSGKPLN